MNIAERIAQQRARMAQRAAVKPVPLKKDKRLPKQKRASMQQVIDAFVEDRAYEEVRSKKDADGNIIGVISSDKVHSMSDIFAILTREQPEEYIHVRKDGVSGPSFRTMSMDDIELSGQSGKQDEITRDRIVTSGEELREQDTVTEAPHANVRRVVAEVRATHRSADAPVSPTPTAIRPFAPPRPAAQVSPTPVQGTAPVNQMQNRLLGAISAQRRQSLEAMDE